MLKCMGETRWNHKCIVFIAANFKLNPFLKIPVCWNGAHKCHVDIWGISFRIIWMPMQIYTSPTEMFLRKAKHSVTYCWNLFICYEVTFVYVPLWSLYTSTIWCKCTKQYYQVEVAYNNVFKRFLGYWKYSSGSKMFVVSRVNNFDTRMRRLNYEFRVRPNANRNFLVICFMKSVAWWNSLFRQKWECFSYM